MIGLDTNVVIRYLAQDDERQAELANRLFEKTLSPARPGFITLAALCEIVWVLADCYSMDQRRIRAIIEGLLGSRQVQVESKDLVWRALRGWSSGATGFTDVLIGEICLAAGAEYVATFDKAASKLPAFRMLA